MVGDRFVGLYNNVHGVQNGGLFYAKEKFNFLKMIQESSDLKECTKLSLYGCFLDVAVNGLSFEQGPKPLTYVTSRNINVGGKATPIWEKRAQLVISPYGELLMRMRAGHVKHVDNPVIIYQGDKFEPGIDPQGQKHVIYKMEIERWRWERLSE